ncbi:hypothetical protein [Herbaspirillum sp. YR522]|uniref:hypothetical protein n=1 Tax=Herbaspirillum sp. YR522 TaxID=1144342 RepID=UPI00026FBC6F|nr:hypothetical protein [Herbaspirillum sp. YR522]EJN00289.1 hypothetical protein PMI40_03623 [Herbaspirillum sp. YR522]
MQLRRAAGRSAALAILPLLLVLVLAACSPTYNWRQVRPQPGQGIDFVVLLPARPAHYSRPVNLGGHRVEMHMTAAQAGGVSFAVATAELGDPATAAAALDAMRNALLANIGAEPGAAARPLLPGPAEGNTRSIDVDARGQAGGRPQRLVVRLLARRTQVMQVLMLGDEKSFTDDNIETFFGSFKPS